MSKPSLLLPPSLDGDVVFNRTALRFKRQLSFSEWDRLGLRLREIEGAVQWWIGDWLNYGERTYGETYKQAKALTGRDVQTLKNYAWVAKRFKPSLRKDDLPFTHYLYTASLEAETATEILERAASEQWRVERTLTAVRQTKQEERFEKVKARALPQEQYHIILADPPWPSDLVISPARETDNHYSTMSVEEICELPVASLAADDAMLFLWAINSFLPEALAVIESWGFSYRTNIVWVKNKTGLGKYVRGQHELLLIAKRGKFPVPGDSNRPKSVLTAARREHSRKPDEAYALIERMYPGCRYLELFARKRRRGWAGWGMEYHVTLTGLVVEGAESNLSEDAAA